ncbi:hypothetical protein T459_06277 [Capsicum annuum]|uniref:Ubiquitin-like protease family profile domain-containing protein n=1 Tax=Capsicum annuum TaxID=4072 RepID=A0A2G3AAC1_CAPAN|nr:hypothetical protein T459_06277 [Capsicum annuum]
MISPRVLKRRESGKNLSYLVTEKSDDSSVTQCDELDIEDLDKINRSNLLVVAIDIPPALNLNTPPTYNVAPKRKEIKSSPSKGTSAAAWLYPSLYELALQECDGATGLTGDLVVKSVMEKFFDAFKKILQEQTLDFYFRRSCFGQYFDLSEDNNARFQMKMVYDLLKRRFMYKNKDKIDEAWAFEAIPYLRQQVNYKEEVFCPRILRWLSAKTDKNAKFLDLFNPQGSIFQVDVTVEATAEEHNITVDNPSNTSKEEEKVVPISSGERRNYQFEGFNMSDEAPIKLTQLINDYSEWIVDGLLKHHARGYCQQQPRVFLNEECLIKIIKGFSIPAGLPWHLVDKVYISINCGDEFHWMLVVVFLKERRIRVYDSMSRKRRSGSSSEIRKLAKILPTYLDMGGFLDQKVHTN